MWGSGCSRVEHRLLDTVLVSRHKYKRRLLRVLGSGTCEAVGAVSDTLLGPEGSGDVHFLIKGVRAGWFLLVVGPPRAR